jgi:hypothetical protein
VLCDKPLFLAMRLYASRSKIRPQRYTHLVPVAHPRLNTAKP